MMAEELAEYVQALRSARTDLAHVEAKRAQRDLPKSVRETLSAFANSPGGGVLILGLDETSGFSAVGVEDPAKLQASLADLARTQMEPPLSPQIQIMDFEGVQLVVAEVPELERGAKPCFYRGAGKVNGAFIRVGDGDYRLGPAEVHAFEASRGQPVDDTVPVEGASAADLDPDIVQPFLRRLRLGRPYAFRDMPDEQVLETTRVLVPGAGGLVPSLAGLLAFGRFPQRLYPQLEVTFVEYPTVDGADLATGTRFLDNRSFDGPIPLMVREVLAQLVRTMRRRSVIRSDGGAATAFEYPLEALREAVVNAVVHRDLSRYSLGTQVQVEVYPDRVVVRNPGGLFGPVSLDRLGEPGLSSSRNALLLKLLEDVEVPGEGRTVCENRASGIRTMVRAMAAAGLAPPQFIDRISGFEVILPNHTLVDPAALRWLDRLGQPDLTESQRRALLIMRSGQPMTNETYRRQLAVDSRTATRELADLVARGLVERSGERRWASYTLAGTSVWAQQSLLSEEIAGAAGAEPAGRPAAVPAQAVAGPGPELATPDRVDLAVLDALRGQPPLARREIQARTGFSYRTVLESLNRLIQDEKVRPTAPPKSPNRRYELVC